MYIDRMLVNFRDTKEITAYTHWLAMRGQLAGNFCFDGHKASEEETLVVEECRMLCENVSKHLNYCKVNELPDLLECYDTAYRIGYKRLPNSDFINRHKRRVLRAWKAGDRSIEESSVFGIVAPEASCHPEKNDREYLNAYLSIKEKWLATLLKHNYFPKVSAYENYQRLSLIMRENLDQYFDEVTAGYGATTRASSISTVSTSTNCMSVYDRTTRVSSVSSISVHVTAEEIKRRLYKHNKVDNLSILSTTILRSYLRFIDSLFPTMLDFDEKIELDNRILTELTTRSDLDPYDCETFRLALELNKKLV